jgi:TRAP-type C4-dicarboxylate transport system permease small subunit
MNNNFPFLNHCINCDNRKDPQYVMNSTIVTIAILALGFLVSFALNQALKETFEQMLPKSDELAARWAYFFCCVSGSIILIFLLMYNLNGIKW